MIYDTSAVNPAFQLRYSWAAWPISGCQLQPIPESLWNDLSVAWERDGLRPLEQSWRYNQLQILFSTTPHVSPVLLAARAKGRLDHAMRSKGIRNDFSRKVAVRSVGDVNTSVVENYVASQAVNRAFADSRFESFMLRFTARNQAVRLDLPTETRSGRYWYNLHLVLVTCERYPLVAESHLNTLFDSCLDIARTQGHQIAIRSIMPDHLHMALRGNIQHTPAEIAEAFQNGLAIAAGCPSLWQKTYYVGTFSEYNMDAIRTVLETRRGVKP